MINEIEAAVCGLATVIFFIVIWSILKFISWREDRKSIDNAQTIKAALYSKRPIEDTNENTLSK